MWILYTLFNLFDRPPPLVIGRDGIFVGPVWFFSPRARYVSFRDVAVVRRYSEPSRQTNVTDYGITLQLRNDELVNILVSDRAAKVTDPFEQIGDALEAWRKESPTDASDALARSGRATQEWISSLKQLGTAEAAVYRVASVDRETLFAIVEDPANEAVSRAAAAIALGAALDENERARLEASARAVAEPRLRVVMEHVVEKKEDENLEAILDDLDPIDPIEKVVR